MDDFIMQTRIMKASKKKWKKYFFKKVELFVSELGETKQQTDARESKREVYQEMRTAERGAVAFST
jgi:hypothetical protein